MFTMIRQVLVELIVELLSKLGNELCFGAFESFILGADGAVSGVHAAGSGA